MKPVNQKLLISILVLQIVIVSILLAMVYNTLVNTSKISEKLDSIYPVEYVYE